MTTTTTTMRLFPLMVCMCRELLSLQSTGERMAIYLPVAVLCSLVARLASQHGRELLGSVVESSLEPFPASLKRIAADFVYLTYHTPLAIIFHSRNLSWHRLRLLQNNPTALPRVRSHTLMCHFVHLRPTVASRCTSRTLPARSLSGPSTLRRYVFSLTRARHRNAVADSKHVQGKIGGIEA